MHDRSPRGGQWLGRGQDIHAETLDRRRKTNPDPTFDWCSLEGAIRLAAQITQFWHQSGSTATSCQIKSPESPGRRHYSIPHDSNSDRQPSGIYAIRSNLINGLPPRS